MACGVTALAAMTAPRLGAQQPVATVAQNGDDEQELAQLMNVLQQETAVATKTRMNSDYVPGIVTVLEGEQLEALGFRNVWEALAMVPGIQPVRGQVASPLVVVRGLQFPFNSGNVKILVDGVPLTRQSSGLNGAVLLFPIEQVERIEVIRGPGSVVYGDFAFMGLINIITRKEGMRVHLRADGYGLLSGGARASFGDAASPWRMTANLNGSSEDHSAVPAPRHVEADGHTAVLTLQHGSFGLEGQWIDADRDDVSPAGTPGQVSNGHERTWAVEGRYERELRQGLALAVHADAMATEGAGGPLQFEDQLDRGEANLTWSGWAHQSWLAGLEYSAQDIHRGVQQPGPQPNGLPPPPSTNISGKSRDVGSFVLQDQIELATDWSVTLGARYDDYSDVGSRVTPRLSLVWRQSDRHIWKAQYAEGFRAPTFFEEYAGPGSPLNTNLDFEVNRTTELSYTYRRPTATGRVTVYHCELDDMIFVAPPAFANTRQAHSNGVELEWTQQLADRFKVLASFSKANTSDNRGLTFKEHESEANPDWMSDLAVLYQLSPRALLALHWNHVGDRAAYAPNDAYDLVDLTATLSDLFGHGFGLRAGVKNALDDQAIYLLVPPTGVIVPNAYHYGGAVVWGQVSWHH
jgi:iron complex outermembrane receptor protein